MAAVAFTAVFCSFIWRKKTFFSELNPIDASDSVFTFGRTKQPTMIKNIPFIHNYCNRWCERCPFTNSCAVFEREMNDTEDQDDDPIKAALNKVSKNFKAALKMIRERAAEMGIDIVNITEEERKAIDVEMELERKATEEDPLVTLCEQYHDLASSVLYDEVLWTKIADDLISQDQMGIVPRKEMNQRLEVLKDSKEVISWHMRFIQVKFMRAISGLLDQFQDEDEVQSDSNGSAKIALIAVADSQKAWLDLSQSVLEEDLVLPILGILSTIDKAAKEKFPRAREFVRPGFDEVEKIATLSENLPINS